MVLIVILSVFAIIGLCSIIPFRWFVFLSGMSFLFFLIVGSITAVIFSASMVSGITEMMSTIAFWEMF